MKRNKEVISLIVAFIAFWTLVLLEAPYWTLVLIIAIEEFFLLLHRRMIGREKSKASLDIEACDPKELKRYKKDLIIAFGIPLGYMTSNRRASSKEPAISEELLAIASSYKGHDSLQVDTFAESKKVHKKEEELK